MQSESTTGKGLLLNLYDLQGLLSCWSTAFGRLGSRKRKRLPSEGGTSTNQSSPSTIWYPVEQNSCIPSVSQLSQPYSVGSALSYKAGKVTLTENGEEWAGSLIPVKTGATASFLLKFDRDLKDRKERITLCKDGRLMVEHFNPAAQARPDQIGIGEKK